MSDDCITTMREPTEVEVREMVDPTPLVGKVFVGRIITAMQRDELPPEVKKLAVLIDQRLEMYCLPEGIDPDGALAPLPERALPVREVPPFPLAAYRFLTN